MKKRKIKKSFIITFIVFGIAIFIILFFLVFNNKKGEIPKTLKKNSNSNLSMIVAGNVLLDETIITDGIIERDQYKFNYIFEKTPKINEKADIKYYNQSSIIAGSKLGYSKGNKYNAPNEIGDLMTEYGFNLVSLSSKYSLDKGEEGVLNTIDFWNKKNDVLANGLNSKKENDNAIKYMEIKNIKIALLSYTMKTNSSVKDKEYLVNVYEEKKVKTDIKNAEKNADFIIVSIDWEDTNNHDVTETQKKVTKYLAGLGVNIILGNNVYIQPISIIDETLVFYSSGNLLSKDKEIDNSSSIITKLDISLKKEKNDIIKAEYKNIESTIVYSSKKEGTNYQIISYSDLNNEKLPNYKEHYNKNKEIIIKDMKNVVVNEVGD